MTCPILFTSLFNRDSSVPVIANITGFTAKWIPATQGALSAGLKLDWTRVSSGGASTHATSLTGLATYRIDEGPVFHANLGRSFSKGPDTNYWGLGAEYPITSAVQLTGEFYQPAAARQQVTQE